MRSQEEVLSFLDLLDLDEEVIDTRLKSIMVKTNHNNEHLANALHLLRYKHLINIQEKSECNNTEEFNFVANLITNINIDTCDNVCRITNIVLKLNTATLVSYSEHLLLQILSNLDLADINSKRSESESKMLLLLKVCDSVLDATMKNGEKLSMLFLETPLEELLNSCDEQLKIHFITSTVPKLVEGILGYDILGRIWNHLEQLKGESRGIALKVLSSLSDFYLPVVEKNAKYESTIILLDTFWNIVLYGLMCDDPLLRKISIYLAKRAVDYVASLNTIIDVKSLGQISFSWDNKRQNLYKTQWNDFFILIDSLEEKQSNIVLPSLQLFDKFSVIDHSWLVCAYNLGLKHDNGQVRLQCIEHRIKTNINSNLEATILLGALNDINFYENNHDCNYLKDKLSVMLKNESNLTHVLKAIPQSHLSPIPFYHLSEILVNLDVNIDATRVIIDILKTPCNIVAIREAIHYNIAQFVGKSCKSLHWRDISSIYAILRTESWKADNAIFNLIKNWELKEDKEEFYKHVTESHCNITIGMLYLNNHLEDMDTFMEIIFKKGKTIQDVINRQYSNKIECLDDVLFVLNLLSKCDDSIKELLPNSHKTILEYIYCLLSSDVALNIDRTKPLFSKIHFMQESYLKVIVLRLYKAAVLLLQDSQTDLEKIVHCMFIISSLTHNNHFVYIFSHEMLNLKQLLKFEVTFEKKANSNSQSSGRLRNAFYETHSKLISTYLNRIINTMRKQEASVESSEQNTKNVIKNSDWDEINETVEEFLDGKKNTHTNQVLDSLPRDSITNTIMFQNSNDKPDWKEIVHYVEKVIDCGGYGCLEWILRLVNDTFEHIYSHINIVQFINKTWNEIEELKSSNHYLPCMKEFINIITQKVLIVTPEYNNIVIFYCSKIIEHGLVNNGPLHYLVYNDQFSKFLEDQHNKNNEYGHLVYILSEILLFCPVPRKDQRISDNLTLDIIKTADEDFTYSKHHFNFAIQYQSVNILSKINDADILLTLSTFIKSKIDQIFKAKFRYHGHSQIHRTLQNALQHLLYVTFLKSNMESGTGDWFLDLLGRMPHQPSVRTCLEWVVALYFYIKKTTIDQNLLNLLQVKNVPLTSQLTIIYWLVVRRMETSCPEEEFHFVMRTLLSHTMGQMFNIRLLAQYLAIKLHEGPNAPYYLNIKPIYDVVMEIIKKTLDDNATDKNLLKLKEDYFINEFNVVANLTPYFIYHTLPRLCEVGSNETVDTMLLSKLMANIKKRTEQFINPDIKEEWLMNHKSDKEFVKLEINRAVHKMTHDLEVSNTIQKKYIPWRNMSDINVYNAEKKRESPSDLIVVASLIDKLPNLGGMARTSEVFGVRTYVIDSLRHLQDRQFQGLSVSAERWVDVEEVRPGPPLKEYLNRKKSEGYSVVAAEQTSSSSKLQTFKFPRKTLLLLGHEKEGIPCDLLPMMDHCVEIPQQGFVRSLNVHVTAAIFVWEYARQNIL